MGTEVIHKSVNFLFSSLSSVVKRPKNQWLCSHRHLLFSLETSDVQSGGIVVICKLYHCLYGYLFEFLHQNT